MPLEMFMGFIQSVLSLTQTEHWTEVFFPGTSVLDENKDFLNDVQCYLLLHAVGLLQWFLDDTWKKKQCTDSV